LQGAALNRPAALLFALTLILLSASVARAELAQQGNLLVHFDGGVMPRTLPRSSPAPIAVRIETGIRHPTGGQPALRGIEISLNRSGRLSTRGLPRCHAGQIDAVTPPQALAACGSALVGSGGFTARTAFPGQPAAPIRGEILLFNSVSHGRPAILAHVYQARPVALTRFLLFEIRRRRGTFGTTIATQVSSDFNRNGYLSSIFLQLGRSYVFGGRRRAYLSASCSTPPGVPVAIFPFARVALSFDDGRTLSSTLRRSCKVKQ
jgi:hypothetical protein